MILRHYPRLCPPLDWPNLILDAKGTDIAYAERAGPLSIKCVFRGEEMHEVNSARYAVDERSYLILNKGQRYSSYRCSQEEVETFSIFFKPGFAENMLGCLVTPADKLLDEPAYSRGQLVCFFEKLYPHDQVITPVILRIRSVIRRGRVAEMWLEEQLHSLLERVLRVHRNLHREIEKLPAVRRSTRIEIYRRLYRAKDFMTSSRNCSPDLSEIAKVACLSPYHFLRLFRSTFQETPHQYLSRLRLERAQELLLKTDRSVTDVCFDVGFESLGSFSSLFRRRFGSSPKQFRRHKHKTNACSPW